VSEALAAAAEAAAATSVSGAAAAIAAPKPPSVRGNSLPKRLKLVAWRGTGIYLWGRLILAVFGGDRLASALNSLILSRIIEGLSLLGFAPVGASRLGTVLKVGWALAITGFSPAQLAGLFFYLISFPVSFIFYIAFRKAVVETRRATNPPTPGPGLRSRLNHRPSVSICGSALLGWYVLFGEGPTTRTVWVAVALSGALVVLLTYRAFRRAAPMSESDATPLGNIERQAIGTEAAATKIVQTGSVNLPTRIQALINTQLYGALRWYFVSLAASLRGKRGRNLISSLIVFYYALSLILLAASAVLFWAFAIKAVSPAGVSFSACLLVSVSHFLPGVSAPPVPAALPLWAILGPGITAWVLLGVYVTASTSFLPAMQKAYVQRMQTTSLILRKCVASIRQWLRLLQRVLARPTGVGQTAARGG